MKILPNRSPRNDVDPANFSGSARVERLDLPDLELDVRAYRVFFEPGARTHWHRHTGTQILIVEGGSGLVQKMGEEVQVMCAGDIVVIAPGEEHWHGAAPDESMCHLALNMPGTTQWGAP